MSAKWIKTKISALASDMTDGPFGSDLKMVHYTDKREARIVQLSNVGEDGWLDENVKYTTFSHAHEIGRCIIESGNIIVAKMMPAGRAILCPNHEPMFVQGSDVVKIVPNDRINSTFFVYMTKQNDYLKQIEKNTQGSTRARTSISKLKEITLTIPETKETQNKLAQILVTCDTVIQKTQKTIDKYKAIKQGMMLDLFTRGLTKDGKLRPSYKEAPELYKESELGIIPKDWDISDFGDIGSLAMCKRVFQYETTDEGEIPFYKIGTFGANPDAYISKTLYESYRNLFSYPNKGDILISASGTIGRTVIFDGKPAYFQDSNIMWLAHDERRILNNYLYYLYKTITWNLEGSTIKRLYTDNFKKIKVSFPKDKLEQDEIAKRLSSIDSTIHKEETILAKYKNIKTGLMARLLTPPEDAEIIDETGEAL